MTQPRSRPHASGAGYEVALLARDRDEQPAHGRDDLVISWEIEVSTAVDEVNEARDGYYLAARQGLSVSGTAQAQAHWLLAEGIAPSRGHAAAGTTAEAEPTAAQASASNDKQLP